MTTDTTTRRRPTRMPDGRPAVRLGVGAVRVQFTLRTGVVVGALLIVALIAAILALRIGDYPLTLTEVLSAFAGDDSQFSYVVVLAVALTAVVAATAGPIAFVALAAPQLARRMTASAGIALVPSAAMGACLLCVSDFVAAQLFGNIPVGLVTVGIGGVYLVWLLIHESRRSA
ncbi:MAG: iron chelate uptake ABC transporter family permease subunit [Cumulibacter sp.]